MTELHLINWESDRKGKVYRLRIGVPLYELHASGLVNGDGKPIKSVKVVGYDGVQDILFAYDDDRWKNKVGRRRPQKEIKAAQIAELEKAWHVRLTEVESEGGRS